MTAREWEALVVRSRPLPDFPGYLITDDGILISTQRGKYLIKKWRTDHKGYRRACACYRETNYTILQHRALMSAFKWVPNWREMEIDHIDGDKLNNRFDNLRWSTRAQNVETAKRNDAYIRKLTDKQVMDALEETKYSSYREVAKKYGITARHLYDLRAGKKRIDSIRKRNEEKENV